MFLTIAEEKERDSSDSFTYLTLKEASSFKNGIQEQR
jgi:hypothetical protein